VSTHKIPPDKKPYSLAAQPFNYDIRTIEKMLSVLSAVQHFHISFLGLEINSYILYWHGTTPEKQ
jgi:hypothetical protein